MKSQPSIQWKPVIIVVIVLAILLGTISFFRDAPRRDLSQMSDEERMMYNREKAEKAQTMVRVTTPQSNTVVKNPLTVTGLVAEDWFSGEDTFRIELHNQQGAIIGSADAIADSEAQDDFIPFTVNISFSPPPANTVGKLVFKKANPSDDPEDDLIYSHAVSF